MQEESPKSSVRAAHLALDVLEAVAGSEADLGVSEIAERLGYTKGSVFRHLQTLVDRGYLSQHPVTAKYRIGRRATVLGRLASGRDDLMSAAEDQLLWLRDECGETVTLAAIGAREVLVVERLHGFAQMQISVKPGSVLPIHATSHGKVALAFSRQSLSTWARQQPLVPCTPHTICNWEDLDKEIEKVRQQGWSSSPEEILLGINGLSAPIFDATGDCIGALAIVGSIQFVPGVPDPKQLDALLRAARVASTNLGYKRVT
ncbi:IclR family transcriptional regulator [Pigmentiphaga sp.]|uniref:IclR family transcriptional regulator n=1 Tax=Pigmentiphaga sp. TaxID=1977564 RepID=UPI00128E0FBE|nr:IclR family transcriptional regulator [Pigmentiphaga sp.]MPS26168.1 IclR family transcriptional regulator [Alcaligenaceae bacterium SAGV5]MPS53203.1 IclR family transcriptional regulator [Alcaligenaceae bacterium SAGV3]MPT55359.1 IclR family transcriptional regulator [Alcaligenaceae bacterium]